MKICFSRLSTAVVNFQLDEFILKSNEFYLHDLTEETVNSLQEKIWRVVNKDESPEEPLNQATELRMNDVIKLGRMKYIISEIMIDGKLAVEQSNSIINMTPSAVWIYKKR